MAQKIINRREFGMGTAALAALASAGFPTSAAAKNSIALGGMTVDSLTDGHLVRPPEAFFGPEAFPTAQPILFDHGETGTELHPACNVALMRDGDRTVLFDAGGGAEFVPSVGLLPASLENIGVDPYDVTHVVISHGHPDHIWGILDDFGDPLFPEATFMMGRSEWDYWTGPETYDEIDEGRQFMVIGAQRRLEMIEDRVEIFDANQEILPGVLARPTFGHSPGHMAFELNSGGSSLMVVGDAIPDGNVSFVRPNLHTLRDQDPDLGAITRTALLDQLAHDQMPLIGFHIPDGGIGYAERDGEGYRFVPA